MILVRALAAVLRWPQGGDAQQLPVEWVRMESTTLAGEIGVGEIVEPLVEVEKL